MKFLYRLKRSGDIFAIEIGDDGHVLSISGPLLSNDIASNVLDNYK